MASTVLCNNCGTVLKEEPGDDPGKRKPCPVCGATAVKFTLQVEGYIPVEGYLTTFELARKNISLLLKTVVVLGDKTDEGQLIQAVTLPWFDIAELLRKDPSAVYQIPARKWEEIVAGAYTRAGFEEVTLTPHSGDYGRDIIAVKRGLGTIRIIDQVKAYGPNHLVTADDVRALLGVLQADKASKGFLTTTSDFAPRLRDDILLKPYIPNQLDLINGKMLVARLEELSRKKGA